MAFELDNELCYVKHCWGIYEQNSIVFSIDYWTAERAIIASNES